MKAFWLGFLLVLFLAYPVISYPQEKETTEETSIDALLHRIVSAVSDIDHNTVIKPSKYRGLLPHLIAYHPERIALSTTTLAILHYQLTDSKTKAAPFMKILVVAIFLILILLLVYFYRKNKTHIKDNELLHAKNAALAIARDDAENTSTATTQFLSTMAHELRTPMYAVTGLTQLLLSENPTQTQKKHLDSLTFSSEYLLSLINNILDLNKLEAHKVAVEKISFDIKKRIEDVVSTLDPSAREKGNTLHLEYDDTIPKGVLGDPLILTQILINLIGNSIKFTRDGDIWIRILKATQGASEVKLRFEIEDNGKGISKNNQETIFLNYNQVPVGINRKFGGTGLGLAIVKNLLELLNSNISLKSTLGKGSTFWFDLSYNLTKLPLGKENPNNTIETLDYTALENRHILVVDDNKINQMVTAKILEKNKITSDTADNGAMALEKARNNTYDLILMDIHMPDINGIEVTKQIRTFNKETPILALTALRTNETEDNPHFTIFNDIILKPYKTEEFFQKIQNSLNKR